MTAASSSSSRPKNRPPSHAAKSQSSSASSRCCSCCLISVFVVLSVAVAAGTCVFIAYDIPVHSVSDVVGESQLFVLELFVMV